MSELKPQAESLESLLSTAIGLLMSHKERIGYKPNSVIAKFVDECVERLKDWPYTTAAQPAQAGRVPELTSTEVNDACWAFVEALPHQLPGAIFNDLKPAIYAAICKYLERAVLAKRVPMQQISDGEFAPDAKLLELADKIDHEQNWRHSGIFQRDHLTQDQKDRVLAGVMLRRYADLMAPESWRLFPPKSVVSHSYRAATLEAVVKMAERHGIVGEKGGA